MRRELLAAVTSASVVQVRVGESTAFVLSAQDQQRLSELLQKTTKSSLAEIREAALAKEADQAQELKRKTDAAPQVLKSAVSDLQEAWRHLPSAIPDTIGKDRVTEFKYDFWVDNSGCTLHLESSEQDWYHLDGNGYHDRDGYYNQTAGEPRTHSILGKLGYISDVAKAAGFDGGFSVSTLPPGSGYFHFSRLIEPSLLIRLHDDLERISESCKLLVP